MHHDTLTSFKGQLMLPRIYLMMLLIALALVVGVCDSFAFLQPPTFRWRAYLSLQENIPSQPSFLTINTGKNPATILRMGFSTNYNPSYNSTSTMLRGGGSEMYNADSRPSRATSTRYEYSIPQVQEKSPFPMMPSQTFLNLASSQFEILVNSVTYHSHSGPSMDERQSKIKSLALYLPQENPNTGQLEFVPSLVFPTHPKSERIFIASDAQSGMPPTIPPTLTQLPGFAHAATLLPTYPFTTTANTATSSGAVGTPEEVFCDLKSSTSGQGQVQSASASASASTLSLPLFSGSQTIGILLIWGSEPGLQHVPKTIARSMWTNEDKKQIQRVGETLAIAMCMDSERFQSKIRSDEIRVAMANNLHQVKNPVQALRTFSKLLQRNLAIDGAGGSGNVSLARLVDDMVVQSERVSDLLLPIDSIISSMEETNGNVGVGDSFHQGLLMPTTSTEHTSLVVSTSSSIRKRQSHQSIASVPPNSNARSLPSKIGSGPGRQNALAKLESTFQNDSKSNQLDLRISFVPDVLEVIFSSSKAMAAELGIDLKIEGAEEELPGVSIHPKLLQEAVVNVLDNAIKYVKMGANGKYGVENINPSIRFTLAPNKDDLPSGVTITIEDNGPGIPEIDRNSIFRRGYRGSLTDGVPGSGIGLNISRMMIERMGGSLDLVDCSNGFTMCFVLFRKPFEK